MQTVASARLVLTSVFGFVMRLDAPVFLAYLSRCCPQVATGENHSAAMTVDGQVLRALLAAESPLDRRIDPFALQLILLRLATTKQTVTNVFNAYLGYMMPLVVPSQHSVF
jgi:hypothetical protein